jgi:hypothetical protein
MVWSRSDFSISAAESRYGSRMLRYVSPGTPNQPFQAHGVHRVDDCAGLLRHFVGKIRVDYLLAWHSGARRPYRVYRLRRFSPERGQGFLSRLDRIARKFAPVKFDPQCVIGTCI